MLRFEKIDSELQKKLNTWRTKRNEFLRYAKLCEEIYYNDVDDTKSLFTKEQLEKIKEYTDIPVAVNMIYPNISQKISILNKGKPSFKVVQYDEKGKGYTDVLNKIIKKVLYDSVSSLEFEEIITDTIVKGIAVFGVLEDESKVPRVKVKHLQHEEVILDPNSRDLDLEDMEGYWLEKEITLETFKFKYGFIVEELKKKDPDITFETFTSVTSPSSSELVSYDKAKVTIREYFTKVYSTAFYIENPETKDVTIVFRENLVDKDADFILDTAIDAEFNLYVKRHLFFGDYLVYEEVLPLTKYPIKASFYERRKNIYDSLGLVHFLIPLQQSYQKLLQLAIINGMIVNNASYIVPKNSITPADKNEWMKKANKPGIIKEYVPQIIDGNILRPEREQFQNLSNFFPMIIEHMRSGIEFTSGINQAVRGEPSPNIEVYSTLRSLQEAASYRIDRAFSRIQTPITLIGNVLLEYIINTIRPEDYIVLFDQEDFQMEEIKIDPDLTRNAKMLKFGLIAIPSENLPTHRLATALELMKLASNSSDPIERRVYTQKAFELSDIASFKEIQKQIDYATQLLQQMQQLNQTIERQQQIITQLENRIVRAEVDNKVLMETIRLIKKENEESIDNNQNKY